MCSAGKVCYIVTQGVYIHTPSLHSVCVCDRSVDFPGMVRYEAGSHAVLSNLAPH